MNPPFLLVAPDRLRIREGGGCMSVFGIPFFAAGVFLILTILGVVPVSNASALSGYTWAFLVLMSIAFTVVGGALVFGRSWTTIDRSRSEVIKQWGLLNARADRSAARIRRDHTGLHRGRLGLSRSISCRLEGPEGPRPATVQFHRVCESARVCQGCRRASSTGSRGRLNGSSGPAACQSNRRAIPGAPSGEDVALSSGMVCPPGARSQVTRETGNVTIVIPSRRMHALAATLVPIAIPLVIGLHSHGSSATPRHRLRSPGRFSDS